MTPTTTPYVQLPDSVQQSSISWRAIFAGAFVSLLTYMVLMSLGMAVGSGALQGLIVGQGSGQAFGVGAAIWMILATVASLFAGSYAAGRVSGMIPIRVGRIQGIVVAGLFFAMLFSQVGAAIGLIGRGVGSTVGTVAGAAGDAAQNPQVQSMIDEALGGLDLRTPPETIARGLATRLIRGDTDGAVTYLSRQAGIPEAEARARIDGISQDVTRAATDAGVAATRAMRVAGWSLFGALLIGMLAGMVGGGIGARANLRSPLSAADEDAMAARPHRKSAA